MERRLVGVGLLFALATTAFGIAIPVLVQRVIDDSIVAGDHSELALYLVLIAVCACLRFATNSARRAITSRIGIVIENRLRAKLYDAYLTYPRAFYDRHATGQVLSRATNDLYPIRYFIGWGVVQVCSSVMMIVGVTIVLLSVNARLMLYAGLTMPLIALLTWRFARLVTPLSRIVQQRKADLTEAADESIVGMEMVQAFGREAEVKERFRERAEGVRASSLREAGVEARYLPGLTFLPSMAIASVLFFGGRDVIDGNLTIGAVRALQQPAAAARVAARGARLDPQPRAARDRLGQPRVRVARRRAAAARGRAARAAARGRPRRALRGRLLRLRRRLARPLRPRPRDHGRARSSPSAARPARASRRCSTCSRASTTPTPAACASAASRSRRCARPTCAPPSRS